MSQNRFIPFARPWIDDAEITAVGEVIASKWISTGPKTEEFERRFAEYIGVKHALAVSSCTAALHLALIAAGVGEGDEVITTPYTFTATAEAINYTRAKPVFVDINSRTLNIDLTKIPEKLSPRTRAILPVHIAGVPCDMDALSELCQKHDLLLVDDAAHAIPTDYKGQRVGSIGDMSAFSFYANKNLTTGEGGMITTNDDTLAKLIKPMRLHGLNKDAWTRQSNRSAWHYQVDSQGYKYNMTDIQAAMGLCQLTKLDEQTEIRRRHVQTYNEALETLPEVVTPLQETINRHSCHLYIIQLQTERLRTNRDEFIEAMRQANIECSVHYTPLHLFQFYQQQYGYRAGDFPCAESTFERVVSLPLHPNLETEDIHIVVDTIKSILY